MSRPLRVEYPGALFHVIARGNAKQDIFLDDRDRTRFLDLLGDGVARFDWIALAYALMPNHFHLAVQLRSETLSRGMQWLNGQYAIAFNGRHGRVGHLLQGRFKSPLVQKEAYCLELLRYIVLNPVRAKIVTRPEDSPWTSYRATIGSIRAPEWLAVDDVLVQFGPDRQYARAAYQGFVEAAIGFDNTRWKDFARKAYLGNDAWKAEIRERIQLKPRNSEHPRSQRVIGAPSMAEVIGAVAEYFSVDTARIRYGPERTARMVAAWVGWNEALLTGPQIAAGLRLRSSGHVSTLVRRCDRELDRDRGLRDVVDACRSTIRRKSRIEDLTP